MAERSIGDNRDGNLADRLARAELVAIVDRIMSTEGTQEELDSLLALLDRQGPTPDGFVSGLIYYPEEHGLGPAPRPAEIVERLLAYRPITL
ncbi:e9imm peptide [Plantactinospora sp. KLBMP9567]|uniref:e9imm peptide n=1 Tax=Plantactinospora sp. KLBMP9567 TaxID=3085900 RepID=UPI002981BA71|nr:e9imm peptide [Plantactinospora sp. KLBMP9567]MDW5330734.1 e9imm peptide [Plantactinospora sp. KLBMP9567]